MGTDARVRYTKLTFRKALFACMEEKPLSEITVSEVCEHAGLNRATFYRHYKSCNDIIVEVEQELLDELRELLKSGKKSGEELIDAVLDTLEREKKLHEYDGEDAFSEDFQEELISMAEEYFMGGWIKALKKAAPSEARLALESVITAALHAITNQKHMYDRDTIIRVIMSMRDGFIREYADTSSPDGKMASDRLEDKETEEVRRLLDSIASSYNVAYKVNMSDDSFELIRLDSKFIDRAKMESFGTFTEVKESLRGIIHPNDIRLLFAELEYDTIRKKLKDTNAYRVEYRVLLNNVTSWHRVNITKIDDDSIAIGFAESDLSITKRRLEEKRYGEYFALFAVDIDTGMIKVIKNEERYQVVKVGESAPYTSYIQGLAETFEGEPREFFMQLSDLEYAKRELAVEDKRTFAYKSTRFAGDRWIDTTTFVIMRHDDGTPAMFTLGFSIVDALATEREELRKFLESALENQEKQQKELSEALAMAESASRAKTEFLFNMSHDVRTPMNAILGFTNMAEKHIDDREKVMDCLEKTKQSGNLLLSLINGVLDMSRIEHGSAESEETPGDVRLSFAGIETALYEEAEKKDLKLSFEIGNITDCYVYADYGRCLRIFTNLITNSIKYTKEGGYIKVRCDQVSPVENGCASYQYTVEDNGIGMSKEFQKHMYEPFTREYNSTTSGIEGTGLGLAVCRTFVDYLGGTIYCESEPGKGTKFTVILPLKVQEGMNYINPYSGTLVSALDDTEPQKPVNFIGRKVLLVEDNELNREIATDILVEEGLIVDEASDGSAAVEILRKSGPDFYDFIIMDIQMPVMNGYEATKAIRKMYPDVHIPIIALSANAFEEDKAASIAAGLDDHVAKPINIGELFGSLSKFLKK